MARRAAVFDDVLYAQCWEDPHLDRAAFRAGPDDVVFSITSGGCNALAFLLDDPRQVIALDLNPHQGHLLDLKMAAFRGLDHAGVLRFLGVSDCHRRLESYASLRHHLRPESRAFWDGQPGKIRGGILHCGRFEGYLRLVRTWLYRLMGRSLVEELVRTRNPGQRRSLYRRRWDGWRWRLLTRVLLSRTVMTRLFDRAFFAQLEEQFSFGERFRQRAKHALTELPSRENPFLNYMLLGRFADAECLPIYLRPESYETIRERLDRVEIVTDDCARFFRTLPRGSISRFNFTNIFEWLPAPVYEALLRETIRVARDGAILTYRNLLVPRRRPDALAAWLEPLAELARGLHRVDLSFIYSAYVVERVRAGRASCPTT